MPKLSVTIITFNEERNIGRCIESVLPVADDIVVIDSNSSDRTKEICERYGVNFIIKPWQNYSVSRNNGAAIAKHDWILALDADEALSPELVDSINKLKQGTALPFCKFKRLTNYCGKWIHHCGWYPDIKSRIYDRTRANYQGVIHEQLNPIPEKFILLKGDLFHYSYYSIEEHIAQLNRFTTLTAKTAFDKGKSSNLFFITFAPLFKFVKSYLLQLGFLDGYYGLVVCTISAHATFYKYLKLKMLWSKNEPKN